MNCLRMKLLPKGSHFFNGTKDDAKLSRCVREPNYMPLFKAFIYQLFLTQCIKGKLSQMRSNSTPSFTITDGVHRRPKFQFIHLPVIITIKLLTVIFIRYN